jgi:CO/xanthine dehydrogenase FAD-binding subunit
VRAAEAERLLREGRVAEAGEAAAEAAAPTADANGSVEYKRNLVRVLVGRAFADAAAQARATDISSYGGFVAYLAARNETG